MAQRTRDAEWAWTEAAVNPEVARLEAKAATEARLAGPPQAGTNGEDDQTTNEIIHVGREDFKLVAVNDEWVNVRSESESRTYSVSVEDGEATGCSCPDDSTRVAMCKHRRAVEKDA